VRKNTRVLRISGAAAAAALAVSLGAVGHAGAAQSASASVANDRLTVVGTQGADTVLLGLDANDPNTLHVDLNGIGQTFDRKTFTAVTVELGAGDDVFAIDGQFGDEALTVDGGNGNDTINGSNATDVLKGGGGNDTIFGNAGDDVIFAGAGNDKVDAGTGRDIVSLGGGDDEFSWTPGQGSDFVNGGGGFDVMDFFGSSGNEVMSLSAIGRQAEFLRDAGNIRMTLDNLERVNTVGNGGSDEITINDLRGTDIQQANVDISASDPFGQSAAVVVNGTDRADHVNVNSPAAGQVDVTGLKVATHIDGAQIGHQLQVNTGNGNDTVAVADAVNNTINVAVDLGAGQH